eukprot:COSAG05_NODE_6593_length_932_cov_1.336134_2_plen_256_part_01
MSSKRQRDAFGGSRGALIRKKPNPRRVSTKVLRRARARIVETKSRVQSEIAQGTLIEQPTTPVEMNTVFHNLPLHAFTAMKHGLEENDCIGSSVYNKWLNVKVHFEFPQGENVFEVPQQCELVWGWIPAPPSYTTFTAPAVHDVLPSHISTYVIQRVSEYFNARSDRLQFIPKQSATVRIEGRKRIRPKLDRSYTVPANIAQGTVTNTTAGTIPSVDSYISFKINRKIDLEQGGTIPAVGSPGDVLYQPAWSNNYP